VTKRRKNQTKSAKTVWLRTPKEDFRVGRGMFDSMPFVKVTIVLWLCSLPYVLSGFIDGYIALRLVLLPAMFSIGTIVKRRNDGAESLSIPAGLVVAGILMAPMIIAGAAY
jgi:hypothetical protein